MFRKLCIGLIIGVVFLASFGTSIPGVLQKNSSGTSDPNAIIDAGATVPTDKSAAFSETDWWQMYRHDPGNSGCSTSIAPSTNQLHWKQMIDDNIYSATPIVSDDKLYISTSWYYNLFDPPNMTEKSMFERPSWSEIFNVLTTYDDKYWGGIYCLNAETGTSVWNYSLYAPNDPAVIDGKVYVTDFNLYAYSSLLYCLDAETGERIWQKPVGGLAISKTIVADDKIYLGCLDFYSYYGTVKCFDLNGTHIWTYPLSPYEFMWFSAAAVYEGKVYVLTSDFYSYYYGKLYCLNAETGGYLWSQTIFSFFWWWFGSPSPVCANDTVYVVDFNLYSYSGALRCFDAETGEQKWAYNIGFSFATPAVSHDSVFISGFDLYSYYSWLYRINAQNGTLIWKTPLPVFSYFFTSGSPICSADKVIICPSDYYSYSNKLYCMDIKDGRRLWDFELDYMALSDPSIADERVYIADYFGTVYAIEDQLKIETISGGLLSVKAEIANIGDSDFTNLSWSIAVFGGIFGKIDRYRDGTISLLTGGNTETVRAFPIFGIGDVEIEVAVTMPGLNVIKKRTEGFVLGPLVIISSGEI
jgi:outer membrane protein assembly factor BamB